MPRKGPPIDRTCAFCGGIFLCNNRNRKNCSDTCSAASSNKRSLVVYYETRKIRKTETLKCPYCRVDFETKQWDKMYCCTEHRLLAERKRLRAKTPEDKKRALKQRNWTVEERRAYGSKYWQEVTLPRINKQREADAKALEVATSRIPIQKLQSLSPEHIAKYWNMIG